MARGVAAGLRDLESPRRETGTASLYDAVGFHRLFCNLEYEGDRITRTSISMMD